MATGSIRGARLNALESIDQRAPCSAWLSLRQRGDTLLRAGQLQRPPCAATQAVKHSAPKLMPYRPALRMRRAIALTEAFRTFPDDGLAGLRRIASRLDFKVNFLGFALGRMPKSLARRARRQAPLRRR